MFAHAAVDVSLTFFVAWFGQRTIAGFDVRGPFLVMSPLFAGFLFLAVGWSFIKSATANDGKPTRADEELIRETVADFGLGEYEVVGTKTDSDFALTMVNAVGTRFQLPKNWDQLDRAARRFAVVQALANAPASSLQKTLSQVPWYLAKVVAMVVAGMNLWLVLACHGSFAVCLAVVVFFFRHKALVKLDVKALRITRDLDAAVTFVRADKHGTALRVPPEVRIAALRREALRMGIA